MIFDSENYTFIENGIKYDDEIINFNDVKCVYISGFNDPEEYARNLGSFEVKLFTKSNDEYIMAWSYDKNEIKKSFNDIKSKVAKNKNLKVYGSTIVNLECADRVGFAKRGTSRVKVVFKDGQKVKVENTPIQAIAMLRWKQIRKDLEKHRSKNPANVK